MCIENLDMSEAENQILEAINEEEQMPAEPYLLNDMPRSIYYVIDIYDWVGFSHLDYDS